MLGHNMFTYCNNNPVDMSDPDGKYPIPDCIKTDMQNWNFVAGIKEWADSTFGAGSTTENVSGTSSTALNLIVASITTGQRRNKVISHSGDNTKPISVYAVGRTDNPVLSSAGIKISVSNVNWKINVGYDDISFSSHIKDGESTSNYALKLDLTKVKIGFESSETVEWDKDTSSTSYVNSSFDLFNILLARYGSKFKLKRPMSEPEPAY